MNRGAERGGKERERERDQVVVGHFAYVYEKLIAMQTKPDLCYRHSYFIAVQTAVA